jgi:hypothetical protein
LIFAVPLAVAALLWAIFRYPVTVLGALLAFMPLDYMAIELGKFAGFPDMTLVSAGTKEIPLLLLTVVLWRRNGFRFATPDWLLLTCFALAAVRTIFDGTLTGLAIDFNFIVPYFVGRMTVLKEKQEQHWARRAVWIAAILSILGMIEIFILGEGPRTLLYLATDARTDGGQLAASFHGAGFTGLREAATMMGPNSFGPLCMIALVIWFVYCRNLLPGAMVAAGLICSVTRAAWLGTALAITLLAFLMTQKKRLLVYSVLVLALFAVSIPVLDLGDYFATMASGQDSSTEGHRNEIVTGVEYAADHPFGSGNEKISPLAAKSDGNAISVETTYPDLAAEYGIAAALFFVGFLACAGYCAWRNDSQLGRATVGILAGMCTVMVVTLPLFDRRLACWALFPVGLAIRTARGNNLTAKIQRG